MSDSQGLTVDLFRRLFRNLVLFREVYEQDQVDVVVCPGGIEISLWDLENIYRQLPDLLSVRQWQSIDLFLVTGYLENEVAVLMGLSPTSPVGQYATNGLEKLIRLLNDGAVAGWNPAAKN